MKSSRRLYRRSFLGAVAGGTFGGALLAVAGAAFGQPGPRLNNAGRPIESAVTDGDKNPSDITGPRGCTDYDLGRNSDPPQNGRGTGVTDQDRAERAAGRRRFGDRAGCGRQAGR